MVIPAEVRSALIAHAEDEKPNEACGLILLRDSVAQDYVRGENAAASHSHLSSPPRPSRTDIENIGLWQGRPYVILSLRSGELAAWRIAEHSVESLDLA